MTEPTLVYLAEPIDQSGKRHFDTLALWNSLEYAGYGVFRPRDAFCVFWLDPRVEQINREALYRADCLVAHLPAGVPSIGVPAEIEAATARGIPAVVLTTAASQALAGNPLVTVIDTPTAAAQAVAEAIKQHPRGATREPVIKIVPALGWEAPARAYPDDAGLDLTTTNDLVVAPATHLDVPTQVQAVQLPDGYWGMIVGRSSTIRKTGLQVTTAVIDPGYRGPLYIGVWNLNSHQVVLPAGQRLAQLILIPNHPAPAVLVEPDQIDPHPRGVKGMGSSG